MDPYTELDKVKKTVLLLNWIDLEAVHLVTSFVISNGNRKRFGELYRALGSHSILNKKKSQ